MIYSFFDDLDVWLQGAFLILIAFHTSTYFFTKDKSFIIYALYLFLVLVYLIAPTNGAFSNYIERQFDTFLFRIQFILQISYWMVYTWFTIHFLNIDSKDKKLGRKIRVYIVAVLAISFIVFGIDAIFYNFSYMELFYGLIYIPITLLIAFWFLVIIYRFDDKLNKFFVVGFLCFVSFSIFALILSIDPNRNKYDAIKPVHFFIIGLFIETLIISIGLGYKYHLYRKERDDYNKRLIAELQKNDALKDQLNNRLSKEIKSYQLAEIEAKYESQLNELKLTSLLSQMNSHFIFNALNSIKLYIINNQPKNAAKYLNKFSKLIRKILEASNSNISFLLDELETMDLYISIENIRFNNEICYEVSVDKNINLDTIKIPPLILQPFLENAIWHGLSSKDGKKKIILSVKGKQQNYISISITDNGIGRKKAMQIKHKKTIKRKSYGIELTKKRLTNFYRKKEKSFKLKHKDLIDENNQSTGTKVILILPKA